MPRDASGGMLPAVLVAVARRVVEQLPEPVRCRLQRVVQLANRRLPGRSARWGNIARRAPFSRVYGWDRGLPVDRYYIEAFLRANQNRVRGAVLEVRSALYGWRFGRADSVTVLDVDANNGRADVVADLSEPGSLPGAAFDCVVLTQVLQYTEPVIAMRNIVNSLRPGGAALVTVPALGRIDPDAPSRDLWRWTPEGLRRTMQLAGVTGTVTGHGSSLAAAACVLGLAVEEMPAGWWHEEDGAFPVVVCAVVEAESSSAD